jgi:hypothetical protein
MIPVGAGDRLPREKGANGIGLAGLAALCLGRYPMTQPSTVVLSERDGRLVHPDGSFDLPLPVMLIAVAKGRAVITVLVPTAVAAAALLDWHSDVVLADLTYDESWPEFVERVDSWIVSPYRR